MNEMTLITAFFDIGRDNYPFLSRSVEQYLDYFRFWARMKNRLIIYTSSRFAPLVMEIRRDFCLADKTIVIEVNDVFDIESRLYSKMKTIENNPEFLSFRANSNPNWPENRADYNYIMLMKYWCMQDAVNRNITSGSLAWMDFGFNHGGDCYTKPIEFDFHWDFEPNNKIHLFSFSDPNRILSALQLQFLSVCIMGCPIILPDKLAHALWNLTKKATEALLMLDCIDDDQQLLLMAYKENPEIFKIHLSDWFMPIKENGGHHLSTKMIVKHKVSWLSNFKSYLQDNKRRLEFGIHMFKMAKKYKI